MAPDMDTVLDGLQRLVDTLDFDLVNLSTPRNTVPKEQVHPASRAAVLRSLMPKFAYLTNPLAMDILPLDNTYEIICVSYMSTTRFCTYVQEKLDLDEELIKPHNERLTIDVHDLKSLGLNTLGDAKIILCYARYRPARFGGQFICIPDAKHKRVFAPNSTNGQEVNMAEAFDAQELNRQIYELPGFDGISKPERSTFISGYITLRTWAHDSGLLSARFHMLTEKCLLYMYAEAFHTIDFHTIDLQTTNILPLLFNTPRFQQAIQQGIQSTSPSGLYHSLRVLESADRAFRLLAQTPNSQSKGLEAFLNTTAYLLKLHGLTWTPKSQPVLREAVTKALLGLPNRVRGRIWPFSLTDESAGEAVFLVACGEARPCGEILDKYFLGLGHDRESVALSYEVCTREEARAFLEEVKLSAAMGRVGLGTRFRTAAAVMSRLRWDAAHAETEYEVGYVDRFRAELMWKALERWEKHTEEEEFVPEHRVMKIRRRRDGEVVWDRAGRVDVT